MLSVSATFNPVVWAANTTFEATDVVTDTPVPVGSTLRVPCRWLDGRRRTATVTRTVVAFPVDSVVEVDGGLRARVLGHVTYPVRVGPGGRVSPDVRAPPCSRDEVTAYQLKYEPKNRSEDANRAHLVQAGRVGSRDARKKPHHTVVFSERTRYDVVRRKLDEGGSPKFRPR